MRDECKHGWPRSGGCGKCMIEDEQAKSALIDGLDAPYELRRLVGVCRQLFESTGGDAGKIAQSKTAWVVLGNALDYYKDKGI